MKLSQSVRYAILALCQLEDPEGSRPVSCRQLAKLGDMPERFLLQVLRQLVNHGVLSSTRGVEGGYRLARNKDDITLLEIVEAADGPLHANQNGSIEALNTASQETLKAVFGEVVDNQKQALAKVTLGHLQPG
ncbi:MAG: Rrf2 family transcriptional regulator [Lacipirellulaceae bacterium]